MKDGYKPKFVYRNFNVHEGMQIEIILVKTSEQIPKLKDAKEKGLIVTPYGVRDY